MNVSIEGSNPSFSASEGWQSGRMRRSRKPLSVVRRIEGSNPSPSVHRARSWLNWIEESPARRRAFRLRLVADAVRERQDPHVPDRTGGSTSRSRLERATPPRKTRSWTRSGCPSPARTEALERERAACGGPFPCSGFSTLSRSERGRRCSLRRRPRSRTRRRRPSARSGTLPRAPSSWRSPRRGS
jgi:hypothetical protein